LRAGVSPGRCWASRSLPDDLAKARDAAQGLTLLALRALGVVDAHARGLVVQCVLPAVEDAA
jgi:hypothetical protein